MKSEKGNKLIANFMGWEVSEKAKTLKKRKLTHAEIPFGFFKINPDDLLFDTSWDQLMPVVEKISQTRYAGGVLYDIRDALIIADIGKTYQAVIEFIEWYNKKTSNGR